MASRLLEFRSKVGFGGIVSSISGRELARDCLNGDGKAVENLVTSSQDEVARRSGGEIASMDSTSFG